MYKAVKNKNNLVGGCWLLVVGCFLMPLKNICQKLASDNQQQLKLLITILFLAASNANASRTIKEVDYYSSLRASETNVRAGPGQNYPIKFTFKMRGIPVRVISEYDNWNEVEDYEGQTGWISQSLLTKKRMLIVRTSKSFTNMHKKHNEKSRIFYRLENNIVGEFIKCIDDWCAMKVKSKRGWVKKEDLFGDD